MRRAATRAIRATCQVTARSLTRASRRSSIAWHQQFLYGNKQSVTRRTLSTQNLPHNFGGRFANPLQSSMYFRRAGLALVSSIVGYGAWYTYSGTNGTEGVRPLTTSAAVLSDPAAATPTRNVLVIGADELISIGKHAGEGPITKHDGDGRTVVEMVTSDQATAQLRKKEESYIVNRGQGVLRYDLVQLASNSPIEDDHAEQIVEVPHKDATLEGSNGSDWMFWGVFDGHGGWTTSAKLRQTLITYVATELNNTYEASGHNPRPEAVEDAMKNGFTRLDDEIVNQSVQQVFNSESKKVAAELLAPALSGSCALLSFYDSKSKLLRVACTGDSRAVIGTRSDNGKWNAKPLSVDQTGGNPDEANRLRKQHPGEEYVVRNGRVLGGLEPTRAFGDASYKWTNEISRKLKQSYFSRTASPLLKTPPYVTAEPVVTTTKVNPERGDFMVLATDGLWEMLTNEEVVGLVGMWIESQAKTASSSGQLGNMWSKLFGSTKASLPVQHDSTTTKTGGGVGGGQKAPIRQQQWGVPASEERFVLKDKNVATHLIRNALGGKDEEMVSALLTLPSPFSRRYRDDLTVQVVFFGNGDKTGEVLVNQDATAPGKPIKPKL